MFSEGFLRIGEESHEFCLPTRLCHCKRAFPEWSSSLPSAPCEMRSEITSASLLSTAKWRAVQPRLSEMWVFAPSASSSSTISRWPCFTARWSAVKPRSSCRKYSMTPSRGKGEAFRSLMRASSVLPSMKVMERKCSSSHNRRVYYPCFSTLLSLHRPHQGQPFDTKRIFSTPEEVNYGDSVSLELMNPSAHNITIIYIFTVLSEYCITSPISFPVYSGIKRAIQMFRHREKGGEK